MLTPDIVKHLNLMNVPKYVSKDDLKRQYHKLAKIYHPDILNSRSSSKLIPEETVSLLIDMMVYLEKKTR